MMTGRERLTEGGLRVGEKLGISLREGLRPQVIPNVIVVHGSGLWESMAGRKGWWDEKPENRLPKHSFDARMRLMAAGFVWSIFKYWDINVPIIVVGGNNYPDLAPSIAEAMRETLERKFGIPEASIIVASGGGNTVSDAEEIGRIMKEREYKTALEISSRYHLTARALSWQDGRRFVSAETILSAEDTRLARLFNNLYLSPLIWKLTMAQLARTLTILGPDGREKYMARAKATLAQRAEVRMFPNTDLQDLFFWYALRDRILRGAKRE